MCPIISLRDVPRHLDLRSHGRRSHSVLGVPLVCNPRPDRVKGHSQQRMITPPRWAGARPLHTKIRTAVSPRHDSKKSICRAQPDRWDARARGTTRRVPRTAAHCWWFCVCALRTVCDGARGEHSVCGGWYQRPACPRCDASLP